MTRKWKLKEIVLMSIIGVVFAAIYLSLFLLGQGVKNILAPFGLAPFGYEIIFGIWFIASIIAAYVIRKPGVAFTTEAITGVVQVLLGSPAGPPLIISAMIQGAGAEVVFLATRYRSFHLGTLVLAGMGSAFFSFFWHLYASGNIALAPWLIGATFVVRLISGALLAGVLGKWLSDKLAMTGVLRGYPLGKEVQKTREHQTG